MFQQAYNKLKQENDDRQKTIRYIRDNPCDNFTLPIDDVMDIETWERLTHQEFNGRDSFAYRYGYYYYIDDYTNFYNETRIEDDVTMKVVYEIDYCFTSVVIGSYYDEMHGKEDMTFTFYTFNDGSTVDMWLEHFSKTSMFINKERDLRHDMWKKEYPFEYCDRADYTITDYKFDRDIVSLEAKFSYELLNKLYKIYTDPFQQECLLNIRDKFKYDCDYDLLSCIDILYYWPGYYNNYIWNGSKWEWVYPAIDFTPPISH